MRDGKAGSSAALSDHYENEITHENEKVYLTYSNIFVRIHFML